MGAAQRQSHSLAEATSCSHINIQALLYICDMLVSAIGRVPSPSREGVTMVWSACLDVSWKILRKVTEFSFILAVSFSIDIGRHLVWTIIFTCHPALVTQSSGLPEAEGNVCARRHIVHFCHHEKTIMWTPFMMGLDLVVVLLSFPVCFSTLMWATDGMWA